MFWDIIQVFGNSLILLSPAFQLGRWGEDSLQSRPFGKAVGLEPQLSGCCTNARLLGDLSSQSGPFWWFFLGPQVASSHRHWSALSQDHKGTLCRSRGLSPSERARCPPRPSELSDTTRLCLGRLSSGYSLETLPRPQAGATLGPTHMFSSLRGHLCSVCCPVSGNHCFKYSVQVFFVIYFGCLR